MMLSGKVAVVTGAKGSIGVNLITKLRQKGVDCVLVDKGLEFGADFTDLAAVQSLSNKIKNKYTNIDYLFNVAGIGIYKKIEDLSLEEWVNTFAINVHAPFILTKYLMPTIAESDDPVIFNVGSGMGVIGAPERTSYCSSKFALRGLSLSLSKELRAHNIDVVHLTLGSVMTPFGTGGIDKRKELARNGKKYLTVNEVTNKIISITLSQNRDEEYVLYPEGYM